MRRGWRLVRRFDPVPSTPPVYGQTGWRSPDGLVTWVYEGCNMKTEKMGGKIAGGWPITRAQRKLLQRCADEYESARGARSIKIPFEAAVDSRENTVWYPAKGGGWDRLSIPIEVVVRAITEWEA